MSNVIADITISLDGYVAAPGADAEHGLGVDGEDIHAWVFSDDPVDRAQLAAATEASGAVIMGRTLFDVVDAPQGWNEDMGYGADQVGTPPFFVLTSSPPAHVRLPLDFTFVTDGPAAAVEQARAVAGDKHVVVMGGGTTVRGCLDACLVDVLRLHVSPETYGGGTPLFEGIGRHRFRQVDVQVSAYALHVTYDVLS
jgi:dihydrofolate reductase